MAPGSNFRCLTRGLCAEVQTARKDRLNCRAVVEIPTQIINGAARQMYRCDFVAARVRWSTIFYMLRVSIVESRLAFAHERGYEYHHSDLLPVLRPASHPGSRQNKRMISFVFEDAHLIKH